MRKFLLPIIASLVLSTNLSATSGHLFPAERCEENIWYENPFVHGGPMAYFCSNDRGYRAFELSECQTLKNDEGKEYVFCPQSSLLESYTHP